jgi:hypothetical protein
MRRNDKWFGKATAVDEHGFWKGEGGLTYNAVGWRLEEGKFLAT